MDYFYVVPEHVQGDSILLTGEESKHLARVLRKAVGETVFVADGLDGMYEAMIESIGKDSTRCRIVQKRERVNEPSIDVTLAVSLLRNPARIDILVEKATELGVRRIVPLLCERTIPRKGKPERLQHVALSAMKQSGRSWLPPVASLADFPAFVANAGTDALLLIPHEQTKTTETIEAASGKRRDGQAVVIAIGPEGGFTDAEIEMARAAGFIEVSLGERRLRSETAGIVAVGRIVR